ncbi:MAG: tetratricopeptide repeat protein, partial [Candidatus Binatia bacterium]
LWQGRTAEAVELAQHATEKNAQQAEGWDVLGQALSAVGQLDAADAAVARGVAANPNAADLWYRLAKIRQQRGDVVGARAAAARALQLLPPVQPEWAEDARGLAG